MDSVPQVIVVQGPRLRRSFEAYASTAVLVLGCFQIFFGITSLSLGIANPLTCGLYGMIGDGIWGGVLYMIAGIFGIASAKRRNTCMINVHMVLCILSVICAAVETGLNAAAATYDNPQNDNLYSFFPRWCIYYDTANEGRVNHRGTTAVDALLAAFAIMELIVASIAALLSAKVICCSEDFTQEDTSHMGTPHIQGLPAGAVMYYMAPSGKYNVQTSRA